MHRICKIYINQICTALECKVKYYLLVNQEKYISWRITIKERAVRTRGSRNSSFIGATPKDAMKLRIDRI